MKIWFHGTNATAAEVIRQEGFKAGTYFAAHLEDALSYGGPCVFEVVGDWSKENWQVVSAEPVPASCIASSRRRPVHNPNASARGTCAPAGRR